MHSGRTRNGFIWILRVVGLSSFTLALLLSLSGALAGLVGAEGAAGAPSPEPGTAIAAWGTNTTGQLGSGSGSNAHRTSPVATDTSGALAGSRCPWFRRETTHAP